ncbi:MAG: hypothetical protein IJA55_01005 [Clostridia bacterium]|nr:hypothetical protein [Clostridia bacterium]
MKRKALITATAVLLVAVMCLATASYAWFTSATTNSIEAFQINVTASDGALELAAADAEHNYSAGTFAPSLKKADWSEGWAIMDEDFVAVSTADAKSFFTAPYSTATGTWTSDALATEGYLLFSFWVKAPSEGTATIKLDTANSSKNQTFNQGIKYAIGSNTAATPGTMTIYDITADTADKYQPMIATGAECEKNGSGLFVPVTGASGFGAARTQAAMTDAGYTLTFADTDSETPGYQGAPQLVTVAVWLEGMDKDCTGSWQMSGEAFAISLGWAAA